MSNPLINKKKKKIHGVEEEDDEVERLLRAAQDDVLLKLTLNSHITRATATTSSTASAVDPDLDRRYQALKNSKAPENQNPKSSTEDDLFARFDALKKSIPNPIPSNNIKNEIESSNLAVNEINVTVAGAGEEEEEEDSEDEVEKVIKWAVDAARLDPSPLSDDDCESTDDDDDGVVIVGEKNK